jgi:hypothetical protein
MSKLDLIQRISNIPDSVIIEQVNEFKHSLIVHGRIGDNLDETQGIVFRWFCTQKDWDTLTLSKMNGVSVTMVKDE